MNLVQEDQPQYKLQSHGSASLSDKEVLSIILSGGTSEKHLDLAGQLLMTVEYDLKALSLLTVDAIVRRKIKGINRATAVRLRAALELGKRHVLKEQGLKTKIIHSRDSYEHLQPYLYGLIVENFYTVYLNRTCNVISTKLISVGGISGTVADIRVILKYALELNATGILLAHNHPSGNSDPSGADRSLTTYIKEAAKYHEIYLADHIIFCDNSYFSFGDDGLL
jgi:DNA repair protein RadC